VEHTGEWEFDEGPLARYRDANGVAWNVESIEGLWGAQVTTDQVPPESVRITMSPTPKDYDERQLSAGSKDELRGKIDAVADRVWNASIGKSKRGGAGVLLLVAAFAFGSKKRRGRRR
jgi:hypothetical protein